MQKVITSVITWRFTLVRLSPFTKVPLWLGLRTRCMMILNIWQKTSWEASVKALIWFWLTRLVMTPPHSVFTHWGRHNAVTDALIKFSGSLWIPYHCLLLNFDYLFIAWFHFMPLHCLCQVCILCDCLNCNIMSKKCFFTTFNRTNY